MTIILVTETEYRKAEDVFREETRLACEAACAEEIALSKIVREKKAPGVIVGVEKYRDALYDALPRGGIIARFGVGHDGVDKVKATAKGLLATNTPGALDVAVAEHALGLTLALARSIPQQNAAMRAGEWPVRGPRVARNNAGDPRIRRHRARARARGVPGPGDARGGMGPVSAGQTL